MAKIQFENKVALNENASMPNINKCRADDMNEIKNVVNKNDDLVGDLSTLNTTDKSSIVGAINEVNENNKWKLLQSGVETRTNVSLDNITFEELYIEVSMSDTGVDPNGNNITFVIPKGTLSSTIKEFRNGFYFLNDYNGSVLLKVTTSSVLLYDAYFKGNEVNANARMNVWYR